MCALGRWRAGGDTHGPAAASSRRFAGCKVTNLLLIPPGAPLFRPPPARGVALVACWPGQACREHAESTRVCREHSESTRVCREHAGQSVHVVRGESVQKGTHRASKNAVHRESTRERTQCAEHARSVRESTHGACRESVQESMHGARRACMQCAERACMECVRGMHRANKHAVHRESMQERTHSVQSMHRACKRAHMERAECTEGAGAEFAGRHVQSVQGERACGAQQGHVWSMQSVHTVCRACQRAHMEHAESEQSVPESMHGARKSMHGVC